MSAPTGDAQHRYAHGTGPEPRSYRIPREPVTSRGDARSTVPREHMARVIRGLDIAPERAEPDLEAGQ